MRPWLEKGMNLVGIYCDVSYAPQGGKKCSRHRGHDWWRSDSLQALMTVLGVEEPPAVITYGDSQAAIAIVRQPDGQWRTRHLRLRSYALRERSRLGTWQIYHLEGTKLIADFLTKAIAVKTAWQRFCNFIKMVDLGEKNINQEGEVPEGENDGGVRLAKVALCLLPSLGGQTRLSRWRWWHH